MDIIRDGGSLAAAFLGSDAVEYWLMFKVQMEKDSAGKWVRSKYSEPQIVNRQAGTNTIISWQHARVFLNGLRGMLKKDTDLKYWQLMADVAELDGSLSVSATKHFGQS